MIQERDDIVALDSGHPAPAYLGGVGPRRGLHRSARGLPQPASAATAPTTSRRCARHAETGHPLREGALEVPGDSGLRPDRGAPVQPDVPDLIGPVEDAGSTSTCAPRPRRAFRAFKNTLASARKKLPFGIAQIGKAFRNEITPGNFIFRTLEFEQMEIEFFVPGRGRAVVRDWMEQRMLVRAIGVTPTAAPARARRRRAVPLQLGHQRHRVPPPDRVVRARGPRQPQRLRPDPARRALRQGSRVFRTPSGDCYVPHVVEPAFGPRRTCSRSSRRLRRGRTAASSAPSCGSCPRSRRSRWRCSPS